MHLSEKQIEMVGYVASAVLVLSFAFDGLTFRLLNSLGAISFIIYGLLKKAFPVTLTNGIILLLNLVYIYHYL